MNSAQSKKKVVVIGAGFAGIRAALNLSSDDKFHVTLISPSSHFEYHAALYRVVTGRNPLEVCIPLTEIFSDRSVELCKDRISHINTAENRVVSVGGFHYTYDYLIVAVGSETSYFDIEGIKDYAFGFKTITEALLLKKHLHEVFSRCASTSDIDTKKCGTHIIVIGGGATGIELSSELMLYAKTLAKKHKLDHKLLQVDLIEAKSQLLPDFPHELSSKITKRLFDLGVNVYLNKKIVKEDVNTLYLEDMKIGAKTIVWTAGTQANRLLMTLDTSLNRRGQALVDSNLRPTGLSSVFILGDCAATKYSGMAQTAVTDANYVTECIRNIEDGVTLTPYCPKIPYYAIPVGGMWAVYYSQTKNILHFGMLGWILRRLADLEFFRSILPFKKAIRIFLSGRKLCEQCEICSHG